MALARRDSVVLVDYLNHDSDDVPVFIEHHSLTIHNGQLVWRQSGRWIKYEQGIEGQRWSRPHVASMDMGALEQLRTIFKNDTVLLLDYELHGQHMTFQNVRGRFTSRTFDVLEKCIAASTKRDVPTKQHHIQKGAYACIVKTGVCDELQEPVSVFIRLKNPVELAGFCEASISTKFIFVTLLPPDVAGSTKEIGRCFATMMSDGIFQRVAQLTPNDEERCRAHMVAGMNEFLGKTTVLPPAAWDRKIRLEPPAEAAGTGERVKDLQLHAAESDMTQDEQQALMLKLHDIDHEDEHEGLARTGRLFGGLIDDIKRKSKTYISDYTDALDVRCISSFVFLYFAIITPIITFGGLLGDATNNEIAAMESIVGGAMAGTIFHIFSGQPLTIIGATGPILVFDTIVYQLCTDTFEIPFLPFRAWIGIWTGLACIIMVATDASFLVKYITRYTEESFSTLISIIFIYDGIKKIVGVNSVSAIWKGFNKNDLTTVICDCMAPPAPTNHWNSTWDLNPVSKYQMVAADYRKDNPQQRHQEHLPHQFFAVNETHARCLYGIQESKSVFNRSATNWSELGLNECKQHCGLLKGTQCGYTPDVFVFSAVLSLGTFIIATKLKGFKTTGYLPTKVRGYISDFAVIIAIALMVLLDSIVGISTPKLIVPQKFEPTLGYDVRNWMTPLFGDKDKGGILEWYWALVAIIPALLATILIFLDQQITAVIVNRRENKLKKGVGYHLDLFVVAVMIIICSVMGLPWFVAATVLSITHVNSLKKEGATAAPGEKAKFDGVVEQRVTGILIFVSIGCSVFMVEQLRMIPMPVLYGVFLYMGISSLGGVQLFERICLMFMPSKHQPDNVYLRHIPLKRIYLFTTIQIAGLVILWTIKVTKPYSIAFPLMVAAIVVIRMSFDKLGVFTQRELSWLDDVMPEEEKKLDEQARKAGVM